MSFVTKFRQKAARADFLSPEPKLFKQADKKQIKLFRAIDSKQITKSENPKTPGSPINVMKDQNKVIRVEISPNSKKSQSITNTGQKSPILSPDNSILSKNLDSKQLSTFQNNSRRIENKNYTKNSYSNNSKNEKINNQSDNKSKFNEKITNGDPSIIKIYTFSQIVFEVNINDSMHHLIEWPNNHINIKSGSCIYDKNSSLSNNKFQLMYQFKSVRESTVENVESMRLRTEFKNRISFNKKCSSCNLIKQKIDNNQSQFLNLRSKSRSSSRISNKKNNLIQDESYFEDNQEKQLNNQKENENYIQDQKQQIIQTQKEKSNNDNNNVIEKENLIREFIDLKNQKKLPIRNLNNSREKLKSILEDKYLESIQNNQNLLNQIKNYPECRNFYQFKVEIETQKFENDNDINGINYNGKIICKPKLNKHVDKKVVDQDEIKIRLNKLNSLCKNIVHENVKQNPNQRSNSQEALQSDPSQNTKYNFNVNEYRYSENKLKEAFKAYKNQEFDFTRRNKIIQSKRKFLISNKQSYLKTEFAKHGWIDVESNYMESINNNDESEVVDFNFSFWNFTKEQKNSLSSNQIVLNYDGFIITTKKGMIDVLKTAQKQKKVEIDWFFPRCFDICDRFELIHFLNQFLGQMCIKQILNNLHFIYAGMNQTIDDFEDILQRNKEEFSTFNLNYLYYCSNIIQNQFMKGKFVNNLQVILKTLSNFNIIENIDLNKLNIEDIKVPDLAIEKESETLNKSIPIERQPIILKYVVNVLHKFSTVPQQKLNSGQNKWIVKPHNQSLGLGITVNDSLNQILDSKKRCRNKIVVQKQIENTKCYKGRKFDIRLWTLISSNAPLISWVQSHFQVRLSGKNFDINDNDRFVNLTNWAVQKNLSSKPDECMLTYQQFKEFISTEQSSDKFRELECNLQAVVGLVTILGNEQTERRMSSFAFLGWDLMVDNDLNVWLLEVNRNPDLSESTSITKELTRQMFADMAHMQCDQTLKELNQDDKIKNVGLFYKQINVEMNKDLIKNLNSDVKKKLFTQEGQSQ